MGLYETAMVDLLTKARPDGPFAMVLLWDSLQTNRLVAYPPDAAARILSRADVPNEWLVPPDDVRFPEKGEMDPKDAKRYRGVEARSTKRRIELYSVAGLRMLSPEEIEVFWQIYSGPLAARGGSLKVQREKAGYKIVESVGGWES